MRDIMLAGDSLVEIPLEIGVLVAFAAAMSAGAAATLRRR
jgi:hypothetical protein